MASLARSRRLLYLLPALLCLALAAGGCSKAADDATIEAPTVGLVETEGAAIAAWSPDGRRIALPVPGGIALGRPGGVRRTIEAPPVRGFVRPAPIEWSPEGRFLRYVTTIGPERGQRFWQTVVFPDGSGLDQQPLLGGSHADAEEAVLSADGGLVAFKVHEPGKLWLTVANPDGTEARRLGHFLYLRNPRFSPSGEEIAFAANRGRGSGGVYVVPTAGGEPRLVTRETPVDGPTWTPDGRWITYSTFEGEIRRIHPDGSGNESIASFGDGVEVRGLIWSPDGDSLLYSERPFPSQYAD